MSDHSREPAKPIIIPRARSFAVNAEGISLIPADLFDFPAIARSMFRDMSKAPNWVSLGDLTTRTAARLMAIRQARICDGAAIAAGNKKAGVARQGGPRGEGETRSGGKGDGPDALGKAVRPYATPTGLGSRHGVRGNLKLVLAADGPRHRRTGAAQSPTIDAAPGSHA